MKEQIIYETYDTKLEPSDWRYAAAILGLMKYFQFHHMDAYYKTDDDALYYNKEAISAEKYLEYAEKTYVNEFHHKKIEALLSGGELSEDQIKLVNECLKGNTIMKKVFGSIKFDGNNKDEILQRIEDNRTELVTETFRYKNNLYKNYCNTNQLFEDGQSCCRLCGFYIDLPKKGKSISYQFDTNTFQGTDIPEFDFIPFAFIGAWEVFFINDSVTLKQLIDTNTMLSKRFDDDTRENTGKKQNTRHALFKLLIESTEFINYDVEVICKKQDENYFETMFIRKKSIELLKSLEDNNNDIYNSFCFSYKINSNYYLDIQNEVTDHILNLILMDDLIELFLKADIKNGNYQLLTKRLIDLNMKIRGGEEMNQSMKGAYACAKKVAEKIPDNKLVSYRQKLTSAIVFKDYDRVCQILLQLSNYADVTFDFAYDLFDSFENHKELAYTFINSLKKSTFEKR